MGKKIETSSNNYLRYERVVVTLSIEVASKISDELVTILDYITGKTEFELDKAIVKYIIDIQSLPKEDRKHILYTLDGLLQNVRIKLAFAK